MDASIGNYQYSYFHQSRFGHWFAQLCAGYSLSKSTHEARPDLAVANIGHGSTLLFTGPRSTGASIRVATPRRGPTMDFLLQQARPARTLDSYCFLVVGVAKQQQSVVNTTIQHRVSILEKCSLTNYCCGVPRSEYILDRIHRSSIQHGITSKGNPGTMDCARRRSIAINIIAATNGYPLWRPRNSDVGSCEFDPRHLTGHSNVRLSIGLQSSRQGLVVVIASCWNL